MDFKQPVWNFEAEPFVGEDPDETSFNLRAYFDRIPDEKLLRFDPAWDDEALMAWDGNFKDDGTLLLACSERDIEAEEYRRVALLCLAYRERMRPQLVS
jgi:hypothetical protein